MRQAAWKKQMNESQNIKINSKLASKWNKQ